MLTMKTKYALKALALLATVDQAEPMLISDIAEREGIPKKFLELILRELKQHGILDSRKGRGGGYLLRPPRAPSPWLGIRFSAAFSRQVRRFALGVVVFGVGRAAVTRRAPSCIVDERLLSCQGPPRKTSA
jgi:hypothetical protein